jgi:hypothetical protein
LLLNTKQIPWFTITDRSFSYYRRSRDDSWGNARALDLNYDDYRSR